jgi:hypothetical protein
MVFRRTIASVILSLILSARLYSHDGFQQSGQVRIVPQVEVRNSVPGNPRERGVGSGAESRRGRGSFELRARLIGAARRILASPAPSLCHPAGQANRAGGGACMQGEPVDSRTNQPGPHPAAADINYASRIRFHTGRNFPPVGRRGCLGPIPDISCSARNAHSLERGLQSAAPEHSSVAAD